MSTKTASVRRAAPATIWRAKVLALAATVAVAAAVAAATAASSAAATASLAEREAANEPLTPSEWTTRFTCNASQLNANLNECEREPTAWRLKYFDELEPAYKFLVREESLDERLANSLYLVTTNTFSLNAFKYLFSSPTGRETELENMRLVAGPQVNEQLCSRQLNQMLELMDDMSERLEQKRRRSSENGLASRAADLLDERHFRLARVLEAYGRYESGSLSGRTHLVGSYEQCIGSQLLFNTTQSRAETGSLIQTRYCWARLRVDRHLAQSLKERKPFDYEDNEYKLTSAVCLPESCHSHSLLRADLKKLVQRLVDSQLKMPKSIYVDEALELDSVFCLVDEQSEWAAIPPSGRLFILTALLWLSVLVYMTYLNSGNKKLESQADAADDITIVILNNQTQQQRRQNSQQRQLTSSGRQLLQTKAAGQPKRRKLLDCLDLKQSWDDLFKDTSRREAASRQAQPVDLNVLNSVRVLGCAHVVFAHAISYTSSHGSNLLKSASYTESDKMMLIIMASTIIVDTFFTISGILLTYITLVKLNRLERRQRRPTAAAAATRPDKSAPATATEQLWSASVAHFLKCWLAISTSRYLRLVPLFAILFWFKRSVYIYLGSGPLWDYGLNQDTYNGGCLQLESWYTPFTFMSAYKPLMRQCIMQSWSVSNEIFFSIFVPPIVVLMTKRPKLAVSIALLAGIAGTASGWNAFENFEPGLKWEMRELRVVAYTLLTGWKSYLYTTPIFRLPVVLVGVLAGYALFWFKNEHGDEADEQQVSVPLVAAAAGEGKAFMHDDNNNNNNNEEEDVANNNSPIRPDEVFPTKPGGRPADLRHSCRRRRQWPQWFKGPATMFAFFLMAFILLTSAFTQEIKAWTFPYYRSFTVLPFIFNHILWGIANAIVMLRMMTDWKDSQLMRMSAGKIWTVLNKLNYAVLLIHFDVMLYFLFAANTVAVMTKMQAFMLFAAVYLSTMALSAFVYVVIENPIDKLIKSQLPV